MRLTTDWDQKRFPASDHARRRSRRRRAPPPGGWLRRHARRRACRAPRARAPRAAAASIGRARSGVLRRTASRCRQACNPSGYNADRVHDGGQRRRTSRARCRVRDITDPAREQRCAATSPVKSHRARRRASGQSSRTPASIASRRRTRARSGSIRRSQAADGQTLGYPWIGIVENWHERAFTSFGDGHGVWETGGGPQLPFYARNYPRRHAVARRRCRVDRSHAAHRRAREGATSTTLPPGAGTPRRLNVTPDAIAVARPRSRAGALAARHRPRLGGHRARRADRAVAAGRSRRRRRRSCRSPISASRVKDSPQSTLVFVTRLDNGEPVRRRARLDRQRREQAALARHDRARRRRDGAGAAAPQARRLVRVLVRRHGREGRRRRLRRVRLERRHHAVGLRARRISCGRRRTSCADRCSPIAASTSPARKCTSRRSSAPTRRTASGCCRPDRRSTSACATAATGGRSPHGHDQPLEQRRVDVDGAGRRHARQLLDRSACCPAPKSPKATTSPSARATGEWLKTGRTDRFSSRRTGGRTSAWTRRSRRTRPWPARRSTRRSTRGISSAAPWPGGPVHWSRDARAATLACPRRSARSFPDDQYAFGYYPRSSAATDARVAGETATLDAGGKLVVERAVRRATSTSPIATRSRATSRTSRASTSPIARASSCIRRRGTSGCDGPDYFADTTTGTSVDVVAVDLQGARRRRASPVTRRRSTRMQWNSVRRARRRRLLHLGHRASSRRRRASGRSTSAATPVDRRRFRCPRAATTCCARPRADADGPRDADRHVVLRRSARATRRGSGSITTASRSSRRRRRGSPARRRA